MIGMQLLSLLTKRPEELTDADLTAVLAQFAPGVGLTDELKSAALALMKGEDIHTVSDLIQKPESIKRLVSLAKGTPAAIELEAGDEIVRRCRHCGNFNIIKT